jgi:hypothetical protein
VIGESLGKSAPLALVRRSPYTYVNLFTTMHKSSISYNITKHYPFKWVTPLVAAGAVVALVLFSVLNFASTGYTLVSEYSTDPNSTAKHWFDNWPSSFRSKIRPLCPPSTVPINGRLYTNNTALQYDLNAVRPLNSDVVSLPLLVYLNNPLENCGVQSIEMTMEMLSRTANQMAVTPWGLDMQGIIICTVYNPTGAVNVTMVTNYNYLPSTMSTLTGQFEFPGRNASHSASLWWAESLLSNLYLHLLDTLADAIGDQSKMSLSITRNPNSTLSLSDQSYFLVLERDMTIYPRPESRMNLSSNYTRDSIPGFNDPASASRNGLDFT